MKRLAVSGLLWWVFLLHLILIIISSHQPKQTICPTANRPVFAGDPLAMRIQFPPVLQYENEKQPFFAHPGFSAEKKDLFWHRQNMLHACFEKSSFILFIAIKKVTPNRTKTPFFPARQKGSIAIFSANSRVLPNKSLTTNIVGILGAVIIKFPYKASFSTIFQEPPPPLPPLPPTTATTLYPFFPRLLPSFRFPFPWNQASGKKGHKTLILAFPNNRMLYTNSWRFKLSFCFSLKVPNPQTFVWTLKLSRQETPKQCKNEMQCICDHSMWTLCLWPLCLWPLYVGRLYVSTLCVTILCMTTLCEHSM